MTGDLVDPYEKYVDRENKFATFKCNECGELSMTPSNISVAEISSAFGRFKHKHKNCGS